MSSEKNISTGFRLPESLHWEFKAVATQRRISDTAALRAALRFWIDHGEQQQAGGEMVPLPVPRDILPAVRAFRDQLISMGVEVVLKRLETTAPKEKAG